MSLRQSIKTAFKLEKEAWIRFLLARLSESQEI
jgi:hypothetical protein